MNLPIKYREVIYLFYYEELSIKEIATVIDVKENTIKTRLKSEGTFEGRIGGIIKWKID